MRQSTKRLINMFGALILVVAAFVVFFNFTKSVYQEIQELKGEAFTLQDFIDSQKDAINQVEKLSNTYKNRTQFQEAISESFSSNPKLSEAIAQLDGLTRLNNLTLQSLGISERDGGNSASSDSVASSLVKPIRIISFDLSLVGRYESLKDFIKNLDTNVRVFDVEELSIQPLGSINDIYNFSVKVVTYYQGNK